jgi:hypothetical protein
VGVVELMWDNVDNVYVDLEGVVVSASNMKYQEATSTKLSDMFIYSVQRTLLQRFVHDIECRKYPHGVESMTE